jgi:hypothetical protein
VVIDGAGTLGRRITAVYAGGGSDVRFALNLPMERPNK